MSMYNVEVGLITAAHTKYDILIRHVVAISPEEAALLAIGYVMIARKPVFCRIRYIDTVDDPVSLQDYHEVYEYIG